MKTSTVKFQSIAIRLLPLIGVFFSLLLFFTISSANAQNISELNQFLGSQEAEQLGIDYDYLFGSQPIIHITRTRIKLPEEGLASKVDVRMSALNRLLEAGDSLQNAEILQVKISSADQKSGSIPSSALDQMPSLKVIFILSEAPISSSEIQSIVSSIQNPAVKILYLYSQPV